MIKLYFGGPNGYFARGQGVSFGLPPTAKGLAAYLEILELGGGSTLPWSVSAIGDDLLRTPVARLAVEAGGHLKVGLEDHAGDRRPSNEELVEEAAALAAEVGRPVASCTQAAAILGLGG
jgi:3-keto-5-aminohexanoate cleavage enzyme